jgi:cobalt-zinc-cadmium efflux system protein
MSTHAGHAHERETAAAQSRSVLALTLVLTCAFMLVELVAGFWTGSLALLADAGHMLTDAGALGLALFATWIAARPPTPAKTYGYYRAEILAALVNALLLLVVSGAIFTEAWRRWTRRPAVLAGPMAIVAFAGLCVNLVCAWLLHRGAAGSLNVRAAYLEVVSDALSSLATLVAAASCSVTGWTGADPLAGVVISLLIVPRTWSLLKQGGQRPARGTPPHLELGEIEGAMLCGARRPARPRPARVDADVGERGDECARGRGRRPRAASGCWSCLHALLPRALRESITRRSSWRRRRPAVLRIKAPRAS